jgi:hypothetical protein
MTVAREISERVTVGWTPDGLALITREFDLRKHIPHPASYRSVILEFDDTSLRVYSGSRILRIKRQGR